MDIEKILKEYKHKKSLVETTLARIDQYNYAIDNPNMIADLCYKIETREPGMPSSPLRNTESPVEKVLEEKELTVEILKEWIKEDESRIFFTKLEVEQIEIALTGLTLEEKFIVESKYFNNLFWREIELNFNNRFRGQNYVSDERLRKINKEAIQDLEIILQPFYKQFT